MRPTNSAPANPPSICATASPVPYQASALGRNLSGTRSAITLTNGPISMP